MLIKIYADKIDYGNFVSSRLVSRTEHKKFNVLLGKTIIIDALKLTYERRERKVLYRTKYDAPLPMG